MKPLAQAVDSYVPELPEVESLVRDLSPALVGRTHRRASRSTSPSCSTPRPGSPWRTCRPPRSNASGGAASSPSGSCPTAWRWSSISSWPASWSTLTPTGRSSAHGGHPVPMWGSPLPHKSTHVVFCLDDGSILYLTDIRQFARLHLMPDAGGRRRSSSARRSASSRSPGASRRGQLRRQARRREHPAEDDDHGPVGRRRHRQHLRRRVAVASEAAPAPTGRLAERRRGHAPAPRDSRRARLRRARGRGVRAARQSHLGPRLPVLPRAGRVALPALPHDHSEGVGRRARHALLPEVPEGAAPLPELPEVETTARGLRARIVGLRVRARRRRGLAAHAAQHVRSRAAGSAGRAARQGGRSPRQVPADRASTTTAG